MSRGCVRGGHLQNGKPVRRKNPGNWERKWKKWPKPHFGARFFSFRWPFFGPFQARSYFPSSFPFSLDFCTGPVSHSVDGHRRRKSRARHNLPRLTSSISVKMPRPSMARWFALRIDSQNGQTIKDPQLDVREITGVQSPLRTISAPKMLVLHVFGAMRGGGEIHDWTPLISWTVDCRVFRLFLTDGTLVFIRGPKLGFPRGGFCEGGCAHRMQ